MLSLCIITMSESLRFQRTREKETRLRKSQVLKPQDQSYEGELGIVTLLWLLEKEVKVYLSETS